MARLILIAIFAAGLAVAASLVLHKTRSAIRVLATDEGAVMPRAPKIAYILLLVLLFTASAGGL